MSSPHHRLHPRSIALSVQHAYSTSGTTDKVLLVAGLALGVFAVLWGGLMRVISVFKYTDFLNDQAIQAQRLFDLMHGSFPSLGPGSSVGGYFMPPLYYYMMIPVGWLGPNPVWPAFWNALLEWIGVGLLFAVVYIALEHLSMPRRIFFAGVASAWWATLFSDILMSNRGWNPNTIPFFLLVSALLWVYVNRSHSGAYARVWKWVAWVALGVVAALWTSLHSVTLFVMPAVFVFMAVVTLFRHANQWKHEWKYPAVSVVVAVLTLLPYWAGEVGRGFANTRAIAKLIVAPEPTGVEHTLLQTIDRVAFAYGELGPLSYFGPFEGVTVLTMGFVFFAAGVGITRYRGNKILGLFFAVTWALYLVVASQYWDTYFIHYKLLLLVAPMLFTVVALAYSQRTQFNVVVNGILVVGLIASIGCNLVQDKNYLNAKFTQAHGMNSNELITELQNLPQGTTLCTTQHNDMSYAYIAEHYTEHTGFQYVRGEECAKPGVTRIIEHCTLNESMHTPVICTPYTPMQNEAILKQTDSYTIIVQQ